MLKKSVLISLVSAILLIVACGPGKEKKQAHIKELEKALFSDKSTIIDKKKSEEMITAYMEYVKEFPKDTISAVFMFKAASIQMNNGQPDKSIENFNQVIKEFPDFNKIEECYFLKGFVFENYLKDFASAKKSYNEFLTKFPKSDLADDAQVSIENMGLTPEQIMRKFEAKAKEDSLKNTSVKK